MAKTTDMETIPPRANPQLIGHAAVMQRFVDELAQGKPHHAYLITGTKGIGKATLAYHLARHVLSIGAQKAVVEAAPSFSLFGDEVPVAPTHGDAAQDVDSALFRRVAAGSHTDLLTISPAFDAKKNLEKSSISVEEARKVPDFLSLTSAEGLWRVVIIDAVDQLTHAAANALLKILEEPPARAILFLVCHQPAAILPTIRSRCRLLKLHAPDADDFGNIIHHVAPMIETHAYAALFALSSGSPGYAITLYAEQGLKWYEGWLAAMQPDASADTRQKFADSAALVKSPSGWAAIIHGWRTAMYRVSLYPHGHDFTPIFRREPERIAAIAQWLGQPARTQWAEAGNRLIAQTETFNLDKRYTIRLLADPTQMEQIAAA